MLGCQLALHGIKFRIFDKNLNHTTQSRALVMHARTLEIFDQMGLSQEATSKGVIANGFSGFFNGIRRMRTDMKLLRTKNLSKFPYILIIEQSLTEEILENFLFKHNLTIDRQCELVDFIQNSENSDLIDVTIKDYTNDEYGKIIKIQTRYLCGCDGAHSTVREKLKLSFSGSTYKDSLFVIDCQIKFLDDKEDEQQMINNNKISRMDEMEVYVTKDGLGLLFPLKGNDRWRVLGTVPHELLYKGDQLQFEDIEQNFAKRIQKNIQLYNYSWISVYRAHHRYVETFYYQKKYFLLGDAAHIHSPVGGQGMNTGLQDAYNLAWKLAYSIQKKTTDNENGMHKLLNTYNDERITVAKNLVQTTDRAFEFMTSQNPIKRFLRLYVIPFVLQFILFPVMRNFQFLRESIFRRISMIGIQYHQSPLSSGSYSRIGIVQPGDRTPYVYTHPNLFYSDKDDITYFHLLLLSSEVKHDRELLFSKFIDEYYTNIIRVHKYDYSQETSEIYNVFDVNKKSGACYLIRPDMYIAYKSTTFNVEHFQSYMSDFFRKSC
ncbi:unnamed protein product [Didymodactylos carnosus]|uniref:FAD-binding domain-containing protein n=1 Tax=Didymodactylos carnosus TaxID=1234261 RepID=A0A814YYA8_9BILA|nr:unnamed protein product [Didymodactylos carnosus]CAF1234604.1 unnamed protein product [Didymodactylos carnosus]CAF3679869.1 unnamed protein product [Didymodactylos carnosus]CAF3997168.1 unnamed protein product [Didymodactylos carnosus]